MERCPVARGIAIAIEHVIMPLFICRRFWGTPQAREGQALKWVRPKQMRDFPMPPADAPLIPFLIDLL